MKAEINKWVLRCDLKAVRESKALMFSGSLFQSRGPSEEKARSPILVNLLCLVMYCVLILLLIDNETTIIILHSYQACILFQTWMKWPLSRTWFSTLRLRIKLL